MENKELKCEVRKTESGFEYNCGNERKGVCPVSTKNKGGGLNIFGSGGSINGSKSDLDCFDMDDLKEKLKKKYKQEIGIID